MKTSTEILSKTIVNDSSSETALFLKLLCSILKKHVRIYFYVVTGLGLMAFEAESHAGEERTVSMWKTVQVCT